MPFKEPLGSDEAFYFELLPEILPHLKELKQRDPKKYAQFEKRLLNIKPELDEDIVAISNRLINRIGAKFEIEKIEKLPKGVFVTTKEVTSYGLLREDVESAYKREVRNGIIHYGPGITKEMVVLFLFDELSCNYNDIKGLINIFTSDEIEKVFKARAYIEKRYTKKYGGVFKEDKYHHYIYDDEKWFRCYNESYQRIGEAIGKFELITLVEEVARAFKGKIFIKKLTEAVKDIPSCDWVCLCGQIYRIRCLEKGAPAPILRSDAELRRIWGIKKDTFRRRMKFLALIDEGD